jgi:alpha-ketoglutarate-dependent taurine dioxygenase
MVNMPNLEMLQASSLEEALLLVEDIAEKLKTEVVVGVRGPNLSDSEQIVFTKALGDVIGWYPNNTSDFKEKYQEDHAQNLTKSTTTGDEVCLEWHLEWISYKTPIIGATWNMIHFTSDPENGKTYFVDSSLIYSQMSKEMQDFALRCVSSWHEIDRSGPYYTDVVQEHPITKDLVLRIDITDVDSTPDLLHTVDGREPTDEERVQYMALRDYFTDQAYNNEDIRVVHRWQQGDLLIPNMFKAIHAVTGGFESKDRKFIGYWAYPQEPVGNHAE